MSCSICFLSLPGCMCQSPFLSLLLYTLYSSLPSALPSFLSCFISRLTYFLIDLGMYLKHELIEPPLAEGILQDPGRLLGIPEALLKYLAKTRRTSRKYSLRERERETGRCKDNFRILAKNSKGKILRRTLNSLQILGKFSRTNRKSKP